MALDRQLNLRGQMRIDVPHLRSIESAVAHDFDVLAGGVLAGRQPIVVKGFAVIAPTSTVPATSLQISVAGSILTHFGASENGSLFSVPDDRVIETLNASNPRVVGGFIAGQVNYVGVDIVRKEDSSTSDVAQFLDAVSEQETPKTIPLGRTADYEIIISATPFAANANVAPIAIVTTNAQNQVSASGIKDARNLMFRLGSGGDNPDPHFGFSWPGGRVDGPLSDFTMGDKAISSEKDWKNAVMHRIWELGGGDSWYSPNTPGGVRLVKDPTNVFASTSDNFEVVSNNLHWRGLKIAFENSPNAWYNTISNQLTDSSGLTNLAAGECIFVDIDRTQTTTLAPAKANLKTLGFPDYPGSRFIVAWCSAPGTIYTRDFPLQVGASFAGIAQTGAVGTVKLSVASGTPTSPVVAPVDANGALVATGISRGQTGGGSFSNGTLSIGTKAADTAIAIGHAGAPITVDASATTFVNEVTAGSVFSTVFDAATATTLAIGVTNASAITIGKVGVATTNAGSFTVTGALTANSGILASSLDRANAALLDIGTSNANAVNISRTGILTKVFGSFETVGTSVFGGTMYVDTIQSKTGASPVTINDNLTVNGALNVASFSITDMYADSLHAKTAGGVISIGGTTQTTDVAIGRGGRDTNVYGNLGVFGLARMVGGGILGSTLDANSQKITNVPSPTPGTADAATAAYAETKANAAEANAKAYADSKFNIITARIMGGTVACNATGDGHSGYFGLVNIPAGASVLGAVATFASGNPNMHVSYDGVANNQVKFRCAFNGIVSYIIILA